MKKISFKSIFIPTISLFLICLIVAVALSLTNNITKDKIAENEAQAKQESMKTVCPNADTFTPFPDDENFCIAKDKDGNEVGFAVSTVTNGYGGQVKVMTGIDTKGKIIAVDVYYNDDETPGLGKNTSNKDWQSQFSGKDAKDNLIVSKDYKGEGQQIDAVTSATISSRAVIKAVNEACNLYEQYVNGGGN